MKSFLLVFFICFVQICMSASIESKIDDDSLSGFEVDEILSHQDEWKADPDVNQQAVDDLVNIIENVNENGTAPVHLQLFMDLLNIVLNKDIAEDKQVKLQITTTLNDTDSSEEKTDKSSNSNDDDSSEEIIVRLAGELLPIEDPSEFERVLTSKLNDSQKAHALKYFKGIQTDQSDEIAYVLKDLMKDAILATLGDKYTFKNNEVVLNDVDGKNE